MKRQSGSIKVNYKDTDWRLAQPRSGCRRVTQHVDFDPQDFNRKPEVILGIPKLDTDEQKNLRVEALAQNITEEGFDVEFSTDLVSKLYSVTLTWMAYSS
jgi:hypothetical protein